MQGESEAPRKKRRQRRKDARPGEIIDAAMTLWAEKGFAATRLEDIAVQAGISKGTIYRYFESKEALFEKAVESRLVVAMDGIGARGAQFEGTTEELLRQLFDVLLAQMSDQKAYVFIKVLLSEGHRFPDLVQRYRAVAMARGMSVIRGILARGVARGELVPNAAETDPRLVVSPLIVATLWDTVFNVDGPSESRALANSFVDLLLHGLARRPDAEPPQN